MTDDEFLRYVPQCAECGGLVSPHAGPHKCAVLVYGGRQFLFHDDCAPAGLCKPGNVTMVTTEVVDPALLARWRENLGEVAKSCPTTPAFEARIANWSPLAQQLAREEWARWMGAESAQTIAEAKR